jgi:flagellar export protein FliJ
MVDRFRLARILRLRTQLREQVQEEVAKIRAELGAVREAIFRSRTRQTENRRAEAAVAAAGMTGADLARFRAYDEGERLREEMLRAEGARLAHELVRRRETLLARRREERQLEVLRERATDRVEAMEEHAAAVALDDLARRRQAERR